MLKSIAAPLAVIWLGMAVIIGGPLPLITSGIADRIVVALLRQGQRRRRSLSASVFLPMSTPIVATGSAASRL
jgi:hypothetical protein